MEYEVKSDAKLLPFLMENAAGKSRSAVKSILTRGQVTVNGCSATRYDTPLHKGDKVIISKERRAPRLRHPLLHIVYEDEYLIVADKRNGLLSVGTDREHKKTAFYLLSEHIKKGNPTARLFVVHRLDRETSGLLIYAKSQAMQETLQRNWTELVTDRKYVAVVEGGPKEEEGTIATYLREDRNLKVWASQKGEGKPAVTQYKALMRGKDYSLVELTLQTGKKNQIRAQMEWLGTPVAGDRKYGAATNPAERVCLHAYSLCFTHPATGEALAFSTGIPPVFERIVKRS